MTSGLCRLSYIQLKLGQKTSVCLMSACRVTESCLWEMIASASVKPSMYHGADSPKDRELGPPQPLKAERGAKLCLYHTIGISYCLPKITSELCLSKMAWVSLWQVNR